MAVFLTGSLYVAKQAVLDVLSGRLSSMEQYMRKTLAESVVGFLRGANGLVMQGAGLGKVLALGFGEGFLGSSASQKILNEDGKINWELAIGEGLFSALMAGLTWADANEDIKVNEQANIRTESSSSTDIGYMKNNADPMRDVLGSGRNSNPEEWNSIIQELEKSGVEIRYREGIWHIRQG